MSCSVMIKKMYEINLLQFTIIDYINEQCHILWWFVKKILTNVVSYEQ